MLQNRALAVAGCVVISWLGEYVHNYFELPQLTLLSPANSLVLGSGLVMFFFWWLGPAKRVATILLFVWGLLHLIGGGILSVIPFAFWPYYPEQSLQHYLAHVFYGVAQLPLIIITYQELRAGQGALVKG